ncbi:unnamed protein product [Coregonus sp. 'balchen']|nr:unnamed protein product [Coregonus sp. 'balchen']
MDECFLFMTRLALGLKQRDLANRFSVCQSTVSCIITSWANFLTCLLGSASIWMSPESFSAHLPTEFKDYADTKVLVDFTELRCRSPYSYQRYSEESSYTFKVMVGMTPHGTVTSVSALYPGAVSVEEIFLQCGIVALITTDTAIMVDKGLRVDDLVRSTSWSKDTQIPAWRNMKEDETQIIAKLRGPVERTMHRVKDLKLFQTVMPLYLSDTIIQLFTVACLLVNCQHEQLPAIKVPRRRRK